MSAVVLKNREEIELMRESALIVSKTLGMLVGEIKPGVSSLELDAKAEEFIRDHGAVPGFLGLYDFPNTLCMSPNAQVVHGIPNKDPLQEGDIISIDCGALKNGFYGDHAYTFAVGEIDPKTEKALLKEIKSRYDKQTRAYYAAARMWTDNIIDPVETRKCISMGIEAANHAPINKQFNMGILQV